VAEETDVEPVTLAELAQRFVDEIARWREELAASAAADSAGARTDAGVAAGTDSVVVRGDGPPAPSE